MAAQPPTHNPTAPTTPIKVGGRTRHLLFDFNALARFEEVTGQNALGGLPVASATTLRALVWCGLLHETSDLTLDLVGRWLLVGDAKAIWTAIGAAWKQAMPEPQEAGDDDEAPLAMTTAPASPG